jgi:hypothetical protein
LGAVPQSRVRTNRITNVFNLRARVSTPAYAGAARLIGRQLVHF